MKRFKLIVFIFFLLAVVSVKSQNTAILYGKVADSATGKSLIAANVSIINKSLGTFTDLKGGYEIEVPANTELQIRVSYSGYAVTDEVITLDSNERKQLNFWLSTKAIDLMGVEVEDNKWRESGVTQIDLSKFKLVGPKGGVEDLLKSMPEVSSTNELSSQYSVRGGNFDENLVYINDVEVYRPFLTRSGEQEGLSIINPDMVGSILFSAGGFNAVYGDRMSSVLDIKYRKPEEFAGRVSASLLGASLYLEGLVKKKLAFNIGFRQHSNQYILNSLPTKGSYRPMFTDLQTYVTYKISPKADISFLGIYSYNLYRFVPEDRTTDFGSVHKVMRLKIYFDGEENDKFSTLLGAGTFTYQLDSVTKLKFIASAFNSDENEVYDIQSQYWLSELEEEDENSNVPTTELDKGVGTFLEHARNYLTAQVFTLEHKGLRNYKNGNLDWGVKYQRESIHDKMKEWKMVDSADYTIPHTPENPTDSNLPSPPVLQNVYKSNNNLLSNRFIGYLQHDWFFVKDTNKYTLTTGIRFQYWDFNKQFLASPRVSMTYKPNWKDNIMFRAATGVYSQSPLYREYRTKEGNINYNIKAQNSYHLISSMDWNFKILDRKFLFITEAYYKYITNLIPYEIDNLRIRYSAENSATGYVAGIDFRLNGEFIEGVDSWASMTFMQTQEDIEGDDMGYIARPTDQRFMFKMFMQDYVPRLPWVRMSLSFVYATGLPFSNPNKLNTENTQRLPSYMRVDLASSFKIKGPSSKWARNNMFKHLKEMWLYLEVYNLLDKQNTVSYIWVADYDNRYYAVPNYLTPRQINLKLVVDF